MRRVAACLRRSRRAILRPYCDVPAGALEPSPNASAASPVVIPARANASSVLPWTRRAATRRRVPITRW